MDRESEYTILVVDDSESDRMIYRRWLTKTRFEKQSYQLIEVKTGEEGLIWCQQQMPHLFLIDYLLPDMTGLDFLCQLKQKFNLEKVPAIILTGQGNTEIAVELLKNGAEDYFDKNQLTENNLRHAIASLIKQFQLFQQLKQAKEREKEAGRFRQQIFDTLFTFIVILSLDGIVLEVNQVALTVSGLSREQVIGKSFIESYWWAYSAEAQTQIKKAVEQAQQGENIRFDISAQMVNGDLLEIDFSLKPLFDSVGRMTHLIASAVDISDRKQTEEDLRLLKEQFELVIRASHDGFWDWDLITNKIYYSPRWKEMLGYQDDELANTFDTWKSLIFEEDYYPVINLVEAYNTGKIEHFLITQRFYHKDTSLVYLLSRAIHVKDDQGKVTRMIVTHSDISAIMKIQYELETSKQFLQLVTEQLEERVNELKQRNSEMLILSEMSDFLQSCITVEEACRSVEIIIKPLFPECSGGIAIINNSYNYLGTISTWGNSNYSKNLFDSNDCWALRRGKLHYITANYQKLLCNHINVKNIPLESLCIPMIAQGETLGLFYLCALKPDQLGEAKRQLACTIAEQLSAVIANLMLRQELQIQSIRDSLTGLFNRRYLEEFFNKEIDRATRPKYSIGVIMIDLDHFKKINDTLGHDAGDFILKEIGNLLNKMIRSSDMACRYGGEEMILILPETSLENTAQKAEEIRDAIAELQLHYNGHQIIKLTASFGVACFPDHGITVNEMVQSADVALYQAKAGGRNQVIISCQ